MPLFLLLHLELEASIFSLQTLFCENAPTNPIFEVANVLTAVNNLKAFKCKVEKAFGRKQIDGPDVFSSN